MGPCDAASESKGFAGWRRDGSRWLASAGGRPIGPCALLRSGGEGGIRTLDGLPHTPLAGERLQPLGHLSGPRKIPSFSVSGEKPAKANFQPMEWRAGPIGARAPALIWPETLASSCPKVAEREGFEPSRGLHPWRFSRPLPSTARPPLRAGQSSCQQGSLSPRSGARVDGCGAALIQRSSDWQS